MKNLDIFEEKNKQIENNKAKLRQWNSKQLRKIKNLGKKDVDVKVTSDRKGLVEGLNRYFKLILEELEEVEKENVDDDQ